MNNPCKDLPEARLSPIRGLTFDQVVARMIALEDENARLKAALEARDVETLGQLKETLEPVEYPMADILKAVVEALPESRKVA